MDAGALRELLEEVREGLLAPDDALSRLRHLPFVEIDGATVDHHRALRQGTPEVVYGPGKTPGQCVAIVGELLTGSAAGPVLLTRADPGQIEAVLGAHPGGEADGGVVRWRPAEPRDENVVVVTAGTSDLPVARECVAVLAGFGFEPALVTDVGVAGLHRLVAHIEAIATADAVVVVAGMEGALASVVGGLAACPVIAVPTSVGYGAGLEGVTALLAMLASCAAGISVVGIDNGFGAAMAVVRTLPARRTGKVTT